MRRTIGFNVPLVLALGAAGACAEAGSAQPDSGPPPIPVVAEAVTQRDLPIYLDGLGTVTASRTISLHAQVDGQLLEVRFREGEHVQRGALLALIDPRPFEAQLHQAESALYRDQALLKSARRNLERLTHLRDRHLVSQENVDDQEALVGQYVGATRVDRAQIETARLNLSYTRVLSPVDGVTGIRLIDPGNLVHAADATGMVVVAQLDPIAVVFTLPQDDLTVVNQALGRGPLSVEFYSRDGASRLGAGQVALVDNQINLATATLRVKALAPNPDRALWPNQFVKAHLLVETRKNAVVVAASAVQRGPHGPFVYVIGPNATVSARPVDLALTEGDLTLVRSGLTPGEEVVVEGQNELSPGAQVARRRGERPNQAAGDRSRL
jgi:multidrug efflux system membrane fusion protein